MSQAHLASTGVPMLTPGAADVVAREHEAARTQREARRHERAASDRPSGSTASSPAIDFRASERHKTGYLAIGPDQGSFLFTLAVARNARHIVEFGSSFGVSTLYLAAAAAKTGGRVIGSEYHPEKAEKSMRNLHEAGLSDVASIKVGDARQTLADVSNGIDLLFLDGAKDLYLPILSMLKNRLSAHALVLADNVDHLEADDPFLAHIGGPRYVTNRLGFTKGAMTLSLRAGEPT